MSFGNEGKCTVHFLPVVFVRVPPNLPPLHLFQYNCVGILNENLTLHRCYISHCKTDTCFCLKFVDRLSRKIDVLKIQQSFVKIPLQVSLKIMHVYAIFPSPLSVYLCVAALRSSYKCHIVSKQDKLM